MYSGQLILVLCLICVGAMKIDLNQVLESGATRIFWTYVYSKQDTPAGSNDPHLKLDVKFTATPNNEGSVGVLAYDQNIAHVNYKDGSTIVYCCTPKLKDEGVCQEIGFPIFQKETVTENRVTFTKAEGVYEKVFNITLPITTSGLHVLQLTNCMESGLGDVTLSGAAEWYNPYGYLPGERYMKLPVAGVFALLYLVVVAAFGVLLLKYRKILLYLQLGILAVLIYAVIENAAWYFYRLGLNNVGNYSYPALAFVVLLSSINKTITRVLVLGIGMGLGVVKWTLGTTQTKVAMLAVFYSFFAFLFQLYTEISSLSKREIFPPWVSFVIIIPSAFFDTLFYYWIVLSMIRTIQQLTLRCQVLKLDMYKKFLAVLVVVGVLEILMMVYRAYNRFFGNSLDWRHTWIYDAFREVLYFIVLAAVSFLWRPRSNNMRYGYSEFFTDDDEINLPYNGDEGTEDIQLETFSGRKFRQDSNKKDSVKVKLTAFDKEILALDLPNDEGEATDNLTTELKKMD